MGRLKLYTIINFWVGMYVREYINRDWDADGKLSSHEAWGVRGGWGELFW